MTLETTFLAQNKVSEARTCFSERELAIVNSYLGKGVYGLGEAYMQGLWDVPRLDEFMFKIFTTHENRRRLPWWSLAQYLAKELLLNPQAGQGAYEIAERHYDLGNDLFEVMLDKTMTYTCGYWQDSKSLDAAQEAKLELLCRKLHLKPGQRILDIGCGWGNFAEYAARNYEVEVVGVTVSREQAHFARERCQDLPVTIQLQDYRDCSGTYDAIVSIEMIEAVGKRNLKTFYQVVQNHLKPQGLFGLQVISSETLSRHSHKRLDQFLMWILKNIFPNGYLPQLHELVAPCKTGLVLEDWHSFGVDYDKTLMAWHSNFENGWSSLKETYGEEFHRKWNFYLLSCAALFRARLVQLYQIVYSKGGITHGYQSFR
ncbi:MAG: cyclopropane fatty acyl phospholipid synthase [Bdellovibrionales bacterium]|nr:cyclopropane fatty acyl phospholipid synthase [Bdellovibrionales bacterium]